MTEIRMVPRVKERVSIKIRPRATSEVSRSQSVKERCFLMHLGIKLLPHIAVAAECQWGVKKRRTSLWKANFLRFPQDKDTSFVLKSLKKCSSYERIIFAVCVHESHTLCCASAAARCDRQDARLGRPMCHSPVPISSSERRTFRSHNFRKPGRKSHDMNYICHFTVPSR